MARLRILLTEGSSLSARQTITALGEDGHLIDVLDVNPLFCLARHSRYVRRCIRVPSFGHDPRGYYEAMMQVLRRNRYDVLFPTHDQVYLLSRCQIELSKLTHLAVPSFEVIQQMQSKLLLAAALERSGLRYPATRVVKSLTELEAEKGFPYYVKLPYSTAGQGVWKVENEADQRVALRGLLQPGVSRLDEDILIQEVVPGMLGVVQSVFQNGRPIAVHCYRSRQTGVGGSATARVSVHHPQVVKEIERLGFDLRWHGALMLDYLMDSGSNIVYIDANPRIGETWNATLSGVPLCKLLVQIALDHPLKRQPAAQEGVRTHSVLMNAIHAMISSPSRLTLLKELLAAGMGWRQYRNSTDEITLFSRDHRSLLPAIYVLAQLLLLPSRAGRLTSKTVDNYSLSSMTVESIEDKFMVEVPPGHFHRDLE